MSASSCSITFGYDEFYAEYLSVPWNKGLMERSSVPLPLPELFSSRNPRDCCLLALHGHIIYPHDERSAKERVKDGGSYGKTIAARMRLFENMVEAFNALQQKKKYQLGGAITIIIDDDLVLDSFPLANFGGGAIVEAAPKYEADRKFLKLGQSARLNHFAQEYGFANFKEFLEFLGLLDEEAQRLGYPSYSAICVPTRYLEHVQRKLTTDEGTHTMLAELAKKHDLLRQQTVFTIERFVACRLEGKMLDFFVDVTSDGVIISLRDGPVPSTGIVSSLHISDRNEEFHRYWFS